MPLALLFEARTKCEVRNTSNCVTGQQAQCLVGRAGRSGWKASQIRDLGLIAGLNREASALRRLQRNNLWRFCRTQAQTPAKAPTEQRVIDRPSRSYRGGLFDVDYLRRAAATSWRDSSTLESSHTYCVWCIVVRCNSGQPRANCDSTCKTSHTGNDEQRASICERGLDGCAGH